MPPRLRLFGSMQRWQLSVMLAMLVANMAAGMLMAQVQVNQDNLNGRTRASLDEVSRRLSVLEADHVKVAVLENDMAEIKWMERGILGCFAFYLFTLIAGKIQQRPLSILDRREDRVDLVVKP